MGEHTEVEQAIGNMGPFVASCSADNDSLPRSCPGQRAGNLTAPNYPGFVVLWYRLEFITGTGYFVSHGGGNRQLNFGSHPRLAPKMQLRAHSLGPFADSDQSPVPGPAPLLQDLRLDALSIITDTQAEQTLIVANLGIDVTGTCVPKSVPQYLAANPVNLILEARK
jgi:hypothetical protein